MAPQTPQRSERPGKARTNHQRRTAGPALLVVAALASLLLGGGSLPHVHLGAETGLYNQEHDLGLLAALAAAAALPGAGPAIGPAPELPLATRPAAPKPSARSLHLADPRAPPST